MIGSLPFAIIVARLFKLPDPRSYGSGNTGATNVARSGNKTAAILTLFADAAKSAIPVAIAIALKESSVIVATVGVMAVCGHVFSIFLRFKGGRGVATAIGVFAVWDIFSVLIFLAIWGLTFAISRLSSLASILSHLGIIAALAYWTNSNYVIGGSIIACIVLYRHKENIRRILSGEELKFKK